MKKALTTFCVLCYSLFSQSQNLTQAEYFIDIDKGVGKNTKFNLAASSDSSYQLDIDLSGITVGGHKLYIRTKDSQGKWSLSTRRNIEVVLPDNLNTIPNGEYFFDTDPGFGKAKKITITSADSVIVEDFTAVTSSLSLGFHKLYTRFKDSADRWSITARRNVEIVKPLDTPKIVSAEGFFSKDLGLGKNESVVFPTADEDGKFVIKIPYNFIPPNADTLFIRVQDDEGNWSLTKIDTFSVATLLNAFVVNRQSSDASTNSLKVFPNPAKDVVNIYFNAKGIDANVSILDSKGQKVKTFTLPLNGTMQINIGSLASGTYLMQVTDGINIRSTKFVKE